MINKLVNCTLIINNSYENPVKDEELNKENYIIGIKKV